MGAAGTGGGPPDGGGQAGSEPGPFRDPLAPSPPLTVPAGAQALADAVVDATTFDASYEATMNALAEGGVATRFNDFVKRAAKAPASTTFVFPISAIDLALEASDRETMSTFTLAEFGQMAHELGWPTPKGVSPGKHWVQLLATWYEQAALAPQGPDSFAVLFIAAMNQRQLPPANIATGLEDPSSIRLSLLEIELLIAAFDRTRPEMTALEPDTLAADSSTPCTDAMNQAGTLGQLGVGQVVAGEATGFAIGKALEMSFGEVMGATLGTAYSALGTVAKVGKVIQQFRYGYIKLDLTSPATVDKPLKGAANKVGDLTATAGVDSEKYAATVAARGGAEASLQGQRLADCAGSMGLPGATDVRDIAADAQNWRVEWSIVKGGGSQVLWSPGNLWDIKNGGTQNHVQRVNETTVANSVHFDILPQPSKATVGRKRHHQAIFKAQLHRGGLPELGTLWGTGKVGALGAAANPVGVALGVADAFADLAGKWALEGASPSARVTQELIEIEPTGLVGTIEWTIQGTAPPHEESDVAHYELETASIDQHGVLEIVSEVDDDATAYGNEICKQTYSYGLKQLVMVEGSDVVGTRTDKTVRQYDETWMTPPTTPRDSMATVVDGRTKFANVDPSLLPATLRDMANKVTIYLSPSLSCGPYEGHLNEAFIENMYKDGWMEMKTYVPSTVNIGPSPVMPLKIELTIDPESKVLVGSSMTESERTLYGVTVPLVQTLSWKLRWIE